MTAPVMLRDPRLYGPVTFAEMNHARRLLRAHRGDTAAVMRAMTEAFGAKANAIENKLIDQGWW